MQVAALDSGKRLTSAGEPVLLHAIAACTAAGQPVFVDALHFIQAETLHVTGQPRKELMLLERMAPSVRKGHYYPHQLWLQANMADAYAMLGDDAAASKAALAVLAMARPDDTSSALQQACKLLYQIEEKHGNDAAALGYYKRYVALEKISVDDTSAKAMAYQTVLQHVAVQKMETEELSQQNAVLRLNQKLDSKVAETNRLYLALLLLALAFALLWMFRLKRSQLRFRRMSRLDSLTTIFNRQHFMEEAQRVLRRLEREHDEACLVFVDLDHFKRVNDVHGHAAGDAVLCHVVALFRQHLQVGDLFGRLGGEEFGILLPSCSRERGMAMAERIRHAVAMEPGQIDGKEIPLSISLGLASTDTYGYHPGRLCEAADAALYRAKRDGRNRVMVGAETLAVA